METRPLPLDALPSEFPSLSVVASAIIDVTAALAVPSNSALVHRLLARLSAKFAAQPDYLADFAGKSRFPVVACELQIKSSHTSLDFCTVTLRVPTAAEIFHVLSKVKPHYERLDQ